MAKKLAQKAPRSPTPAFSHLASESAPPAGNTQLLSASAASRHGSRLTKSQERYQTCNLFSTSRPLSQLSMQHTSCSLPGQLPLLLALKQAARGGPKPQFGRWQRRNQHHQSTLAQLLRGEFSARSPYHEQSPDESVHVPVMMRAESSSTAMRHTVVTDAASPAPFPAATVIQRVRPGHRIPLPAVKHKISAGGSSIK